MIRTFYHHSVYGCLLITLRQSMVMLGVAYRGFEGIAPNMKQSRRHYGFCQSARFREGIDSEEHSYIDEFTEKKNSVVIESSGLLRRSDILIQLYAGRVDQLHYRVRVFFKTHIGQFHVATAIYRVNLYH